MPINDNTNKYPAQYICVISPVCGVSTVLPAASVTFYTDVPGKLISDELLVICCFVIRYVEQ